MTELPADGIRLFDCAAGSIAGRVDGHVVRVLGIPYARAARFEAPEPVLAAGEGETYEAFDRAPASPQLASPVLTAVLAGAGDGMTDSEDCQALSITIPADLSADLAAGERLPVMVWIHGGAYVTGAGDLDVYDPRALVTEQRVIVVNLTYRLGLLGFFGDGAAIPANLGLLDIVEALRWVHTNIAAFGGDADAITLFGQSSGGDAIAHLMISAGTSGLFRRAIVQSAPLGISTRRAGMAAAMRKAAGVLSPTAPVAEVLARQGAAERVALRFGLRGGMAFGTQYGHAPLPAESGRDAAWQQVAPAIDLLIGTTSHETALYVPLIPLLDRATRLPLVGRRLHGALVGSTTNVTYTRAARAFAARHRAAGGRATVYRLTWAPTGSRFGAAHITDLPLLLGSQRAWGRAAIIGTHDWDDIDRRGRGIRRIWADFARTGTVSTDAAAASSDTVTIR